MPRPVAGLGLALAVALTTPWLALAATPAPSKPASPPPFAADSDILDSAEEWTGIERITIAGLMTGIRISSHVRVVIVTEAGEEPRPDDEIDALFDELADQPDSPPDMVVLLLTMSEQHCIAYTTVTWNGPLVNEALVDAYVDHLLDVVHESACGSPTVLTSALTDLQRRLIEVRNGLPDPWASGAVPGATGRPSSSPGGYGGGGTGNGDPGDGDPGDGEPAGPRVTGPANVLFLVLVGLGPVAVLASVLRDRRATNFTFASQQRTNRIRSVALVAALLSVLGILGFVIGWAFSGDAAPASIAGLALSGVGVAAVPIGLFFGDSMMLRAAGATEVPMDDSMLNNVVTEMSIAANLPRPKVYLIPTDVPNALTTGRNPKHASIAVTQGLLDRLDREELQAVTAHEMAHIRNLDVRYAMLIAVLVGTVVLVTDLFFRGTLRMILEGHWLRFRGKGALQGAVAMLAFLLFLLLVAAILRIFAPLAAAGVQAAASRQREFLADATAVELGRNPVGLEKALEKIAIADDRLTDANRGIRHAYFVHPTFSEGEQEGANARWRGVFSTHPPVLARVNRLRQLRGEGPLEGDMATRLAVES